MKYSVLFCMSIAALAAVGASAGEAAGPTPTVAAIDVPKLSFRSRTLANGLDVYTLRDTTTPDVEVQVFYKVGSKDDPRGRSGFAHLFEHLMFKATRNVPEGGLGAYVTDIGGSYNASTYYDFTSYHTQVPAHHLEAVLWMEAERMSDLVIDEASFRSERDVVKEELRQRVFAQPYGRILYMLLSQYTYTAHPYARPMAGTIADLDAATLADVRAFHEAFYRPDNAAVVVSGNFDEKQVELWTNRYLGRISRPPRAIVRNQQREPERRQALAVATYAPNVPLPAVIQAYHAPRAADPDTAAMVLLEAVLANGQSSRLHRSLVHEKQLASQVKLWNLLTEDGGVFAPVITLARGQAVADAEAALAAEIARLRTEPLTVEELQKAKNALLSAELAARETTSWRGYLLGNGLMETGDPGWADRHIARIQSLTPADLQRVAKRYLDDHRRVSIRYLDESRRPQGKADDPPLADFSKLGSKVPAGTREPAVLLPLGERRSPPAPAEPLAVSAATVGEQVMKNGLRVVVATPSAVPLVSVALVVRAGTATDPAGRAGLAAITAGLITRGTATRSALRVAQEIESLGGTIEAAAHDDGIVLTVTAPVANIEAAGAVLRDIVLHPAFAPEELERERQQQLDKLAVEMKQPGGVARIIVDRLMFAAAPYGSVSTEDSISAITRDDIVHQYQTWWRPDAANLIITGSLDSQQGYALAERLFEKWSRPPQPLPATYDGGAPAGPRRIVVVDLPDASQATVLALLPAMKRQAADYAAMSAGVQILGGAGGRLYEEIRVKRGLSYGAGSQLDARRDGGILLSAAQTKNESAPQVVELILTEIDRLAREAIDAGFMRKRVASLLGGLDREIMTIGGLAKSLATLTMQGMPASETVRYKADLAALTPDRVQQALRRSGLRADRTSILVVGSARHFLDELRKHHPDLELIPIEQLDLSRPQLRKPAHKAVMGSLKAPCS